MHLSRALLALGLAGFIAACDGGSQAIDSPPPPETALDEQAPATPTGLAVGYGIKTFSFTWTAAARATRYQLLEDPDGPGPAPEAQAGADLAAPAASLTVPLYARLNATYRVRACSNVGCSAASDPVVADPSRAIGYFKSHNSGPNDLFGAPLALSSDGSVLVAAAPQEGASAQGVFATPPADDNAAVASGAVYVFTRESGQWRQSAYIKAANSVAGIRFGSALALSVDGQTLAVGAEAEGTGSSRSGAVYVFARQAGGWMQQAMLKASDAALNQALGSTLALSADGNVLAAGAPFSRVSGLANAGAAYVFTRAGGVWSERDKLVATTAVNGMRFGSGLALSGDAATLAVGASGDWSAATTVNGDETDTSAPGSGAGFVYVGGAGAWTQQAYLKGSRQQVGDNVGGAIAIARDGSTVVLGARYDGRASASAPPGTAPSAGAAYVFARSGATWSEEAYLKAGNAGAGDEFGSALALSADGATLVVGASGEDSNATGLAGDGADNSLVYPGAAYVFRRGAGAWAQQAYLKASNTVARAGFGETLAISADGATTAVGATDKSPGRGVDADQANTDAWSYGTVYLY